MPNPNERVKFSSEQEEIIKKYYADVPEYGECLGCRELEAKLAEAEKKIATWYDAAIANGKRAEAAEARNRRLVEAAKKELASLEYHMPNGLTRAELETRRALRAAIEENDDGK